VNPIIRGKVNEFLMVHEAIKENARYVFKSSCFFQAFGKERQAIDGYIRRRLRVAMIHEHPNQRKGPLMKTKWNNEFFARIGLIPSYWYYYHKIYGFTLESYILRMKEKQQKKKEREIQRAKEKGQEYYTPDRVRKRKYAQRVATY